MIITTTITIIITMTTASPIHDVTVQSVSLRGGEMDPKKFFPWIEKITQMEGPNILRLKGIIAFKDDPDRYVIQGVHMIIEGDHQRAWKDGEKHESRLVFIGRELDAERLKRTFEACQAQPSPAADREPLFEHGHVPWNRTSCRQSPRSISTAIASPPPSSAASRISRWPTARSTGSTTATRRAGRA